MSIKNVVNKSRFHAHLYRIDDPAEMKKIVKRHRKSHRKANHHCWAFRILRDGELLEDSKNDGEVGHPGRVLRELLLKYELVGYALVVSRIFGGVKLGVGGVSRAFRESGDLVLTEWLDEISPEV